MKRFLAQAFALIIMLAAIVAPMFIIDYMIRPTWAKCVLWLPAFVASVYYTEKYVNIALKWIRTKI